MMQTLREATIGEYEVLAELGRGGMATVYLAHDIALGRKVAIKVMSPHLLEGEGMVDRFKLEARTAAQLSHPHVIPIFAVKETETVLFFVMKFIEGRALDSIIKQIGPLPIPMVRDILTKVGQALGYAHRRGVVHRDVKPGNIMIDEEGTPIVTDFGIAKVAQARNLTMTGATIGTPSYMSPEQCSALEVTGASDQYSLGIVAYEMLTGKVPFTADSVVQIMFKHCHDDPEPVENLRPDCPPELAEMVNKMLAKTADTRWETLEAAVQNLGTQTTLSFDDPFRTQLAGLAKEGSHRELLARVSTPKSPIPKVTSGPRSATAKRTAAGARGKTGMGTAADPDATRVAGMTYQTMTVPSRKAPFVAGIAAAFVFVAGAALWIMKPWEDKSAGGTQGADPSITQAPAGNANTPPAGNAGQAETPPTTTPTTTEQPTTPARIGSISITNAPSSAIAQGTALQLGAEVRDDQGRPMRGRTLTWRSNNQNVQVSTSGFVTALLPGQSTITVSGGDGVSATATINVAAPVSAATPQNTQPVETVARVDVGGDNSLEVGKTSNFSAQPRSANGSAMRADVSWSSSNRSVATVSDAGVVTAIGAGTTVITATAGQGSGTMSVTVTAPVVNVPPPTPAGPTPAERDAAIEAVIQNYAKALESRDVTKVSAAYPGMTSAERTNLSRSLPSMDNLRVIFRVTNITEIRDGVATARVNGTYNFLNNRRPETANINVEATLERAASGWRLIQIK
ncbi:MAG TPA: protein kinase [Gemmatimonadaceae bacterium]|nr:protein kinase [Gemmatimonadaceae bacterium]